MLVHARDMQLVVFKLDLQRYALHLPIVERIVPLVEITPLPQAPPIVLGVINVQGRVIPVVDIRQRFRLPERASLLSDRLVLARSADRTLALLVDAVIGVVDCSQSSWAVPDQIHPGLEYLQAVVTLDDGLILIHDIDTFLSSSEGRSLQEAMQQPPEALQ
jgi:purine-binding chemotaxis protein CheW